MEVFNEYLEKIDDPKHRERTLEVLEWVSKEFPNLKPRIAWNQPMFTDHGTFIIGFSVASSHLAVSPERAGMIRYSEQITQSGYSQGKMLFRIKWGDTIDYSLLERIINYNITDKADIKTFWRKTK